MKYLLTYGAELELADIDNTKKLPNSFIYSREKSIINSDGSTTKYIKNKRGGEIQLPPAINISDLVLSFKKIKDLFPEATTNYSTALHIHIGISNLQLCNHLQLLKQIQKKIHKEYNLIINKVNLLSPMNTSCTPKIYRYILKDYVTRKRYRQRFLTKQRLLLQLNSNTTEEFFKNEVPQTKEGKPLWHAQPRTCISLRQLLQTNTIEFRHFAGTLSEKKFKNCVLWCKYISLGLLNDSKLYSIWEEHGKNKSFPKLRYDIKVIVNHIQNKNK